MPDPRHYRSLLRSVARSTSLHRGQALHATLLKSNLLSSPFSFLRNALLHLYSACDLPDPAHHLFDEIPHSHLDAHDWTALISCHVRNRLPLTALALFSSMQQHGVPPDEVTFVAFFTACGRLQAEAGGEGGYSYVIKAGLPLSTNLSNSLMNMYVKCNSMEKARMVFVKMTERNVVSWSVLLSGMVKWEGISRGRELFDEMPVRNEVSWTVMIVGYIESGLSEEALVFITEMLGGLGGLGGFGFELNHVTLCSFLRACALSGDLVVGKWVHVYVLKRMEKGLHLMVGTALVDMYSKCGRIDAAKNVFQSLPCRNVVAWNAILNGLAVHGRGKDVLELFSQMVQEVKPDDVSFVAVLSACNHCGLVDKGLEYFHDLQRVYRVTPQIEHYACLVDLLGRAGRVEEAEDVVRAMPFRSNKVILGSLLAACSLHGKVHHVERLLHELLQVDPSNTECHVLLSNMYTSAGKQDEADSLRNILKTRGITKVPGTSFVHTEGQMDHYGNRSRHQSDGVYSMLDVI